MTKWEIVILNFVCASPLSGHFYGPSSIGELSILKGTDSGEGFDNSITLGNGDGTDDVEGVVTSGEGDDATTGVGEDVVGGATLLD